MPAIALKDQLQYLNREIRRYRDLATHVIALGMITEAEVEAELAMLLAIRATLAEVWGAAVCVPTTQEEANHA